MYNILTIGCDFNFDLFNSLNPLNSFKYDKFVNINKKNNVPENVKLNPKYIFIELRSKNFINLLKKYNITHVINFLSRDINDLNLIYNLIKDCIKYNKIEKFIHISSDKILSDRTPDTRLNILTDNDSCFNSCVEIIVRTSSLNVIIVRTCKLYSENIDNMITRFMRILKENKVIEIQGSGSDSIGFLHVKDFCPALGLILEKGEYGKVYDTCPDKTCMILDLARELCYLFWKDDSSIRFKYTENLNKPFRLTLDNTKIKDLGWKQRITLSEGLKKILK